mmetsp:Transcript_36647/g.92624  ORF Transcript_36647/g.92624 Transcript_36647/m.92624 type:complete len:255 (+) Transcript_36647:359-1123(+)
MSPTRVSLVTKRRENNAPTLPDDCFHAWLQLAVVVLLEVGKGLAVPLQRRLEAVKGVPPKCAVDLPERRLWVRLQAAKRQLMQVTRRDELPVPQVRAVQQFALLEDEVGDLLAGRPLEVGIPVVRVRHVGCGLEHLQRVAVDEHKLGPREEAQNKLHARHVHRRLDQQRLVAAVSQRHLRAPRQTLSTADCARPGRNLGPRGMPLPGLPPQAARTTHCCHRMATALSRSPHIDTGRRCGVHSAPPMLLPTACMH